jgi:GntR family transcriptional regulator/MocR family aminotransferase
MPCVFKRALPEREAVDAARRAGIDLLGLSALHAAGSQRAGFLMGFAAHSPGELADGVQALRRVLNEFK